MKLVEKQIAELKEVARRSPKPHMRIKALALLSYGSGRKQKDVASSFQVTPKTLQSWSVRYSEGGVEALEVKQGRGRPCQADDEEIAQYILQSPRNFGIDRTRWTLDLLAQTVPCLKDFTRYGVQQALRRAGFSYKRGQPSLHSPDPDYDEKKGLWTRH